MVVAETSPLLEVQGLRRAFVVRGGLLQRPVGEVKAVDGVDLTVHRGETLGIVGESGCGKSTLARLILRLIEPDAGSVRLDGEDVLAASGSALKALRREMQIVFQDPFGSLNPRVTIGDTVSYNLRVQGVPADEAHARSLDMMERVGLNARQHPRRYPHELSGGQRQRVNIARALAPGPKLVILDEPVSSLDKSVQAQVLNLLQDLQQDLGLTYMFISHDLNVVEYLSDRVVVMYLGVVMEVAAVEAISEHPLHPYAQALWASAPAMDPAERSDAPPPITGDPPSPMNPPSGCRFRTRCPKRMGRCDIEVPKLQEVVPGHWAACHLYQPGSTEEHIPPRVPMPEPGPAVR